MNLLLSLGIVLLTVIIVHFLERQDSKWIKAMINWVPAILFAYVIPAFFTHLFNLELNTGVIHEWSKNIIMPLAIITVMSALSVRQLKIIGIRPIVLFASGSFAIAILPILLFLIMTSVSDGLQESLVDQQYWKGLVTVVGSWIGGSTSQLVLKEVVDCPENIFLTILILDNVLVNIWTIIMFQFIKRSEVWNRVFGIKDKVIDFIPNEINADTKSFTGNLITVAICVVSVIVVFFLAIPFLFKVLLLSVMGLLFGNFIAGWNHTLVLKVGGVLIVIIMAILGLKLNFDNLHLPGNIVVFAIIWLTLHYVIMLLVAKVLNLNLAWVPIASMANVGGISTAPAVTKAFNEEWMPHAILLAILSMVTGTIWGLLTIYLFETLIAF